MNIELLQRIKAHVLEEPKRIYMGDWNYRIDAGEEYEIEGATLVGPACGTVACICGWAIQLSDAELNDADSARGQGPTGKRLLDLSGSPWYPEKDSDEFSQAQRLFHEICWPEEFRARLQNAPVQSQEYAQVVADRIDHFIATDGRE